MTSADIGCDSGGLGGRHLQARFLVGSDVDLPAQFAPLQLHEFRPYAFAAPAFKAGLAEMPARGQLFLVEVNDFHLGLLPNGLARVHERTVWPTSQAIGAPIYSPQRKSNGAVRACDGRTAPQIGAVLKIAQHWM